MRKLLPVLLPLACVLLNGCFTSTSPFYNDSQIVQDPRVEGLFKNVGLAGTPDDTEWSIKASVAFRGKYDIQVREGALSAKLLGTLFRAEKTLFLDLYPISNSNDNSSPGGPPSVIELMRSIMYEPRHVAWKVEMTPTGLKYRFPAGNGVVSALRQAPELKGKPAQGTSEEQLTIALPASSAEAQKYLLKFAQDATVFNYRGELLRKTE